MFSCTDMLLLIRFVVPDLEIPKRINASKIFPVKSRKVNEIVVKYEGSKTNIRIGNS